MTEKQTMGKAPACPKWLMPEAKAEWRRLARKINLSEEDISVFAGYCQSYARWREAEEYISGHGTSVPDSDGVCRILPQVAVAQTYLKLMNDFAAQLGLTPTSRNRGRDDEDAG